MKNLSKIFSTVRKGIALIEKASKVLQSVDIVGKNLKTMVDELENLWEVNKSETPETSES